MDHHILCHREYSEECEASSEADEALDLFFTGLIWDTLASHSLP